MNCSFFVSCISFVTFLTGYRGIDPHDKKSLRNNPVDAMNSDSLVRKKRSTPNTNQMFLEELQAHGFDIGSDWVPFGMKDNRVANGEYKFIEEGKTRINYDISYQHALLRKNIDYAGIYSFVYKITIVPYQVRDHGFFGLNSSGDDWYVRGVNTVARVRQENRITYWSPQNKGSIRNGTLGFSAGTSGINFSVQVPFEGKEFDVISKTKPSSSIYSTEYIVRGEGDFARNSVMFFGYFVFLANRGSPQVEIEHTCKLFGKFWYGTKTYQISCIFPAYRNQY